MRRSGQLGTGCHNRGSLLCHQVLWQRREQLLRVRQGQAEVLEALESSALSAAGRGASSTPVFGLSGFLMLS